MLTDEKVTRARINRELKSVQQWADEFGAGYYAMYDAIKGRTFRNLATPPGKTINPLRKLTPDQVRDIRVNRSGLTMAGLAKKHGLSETAVASAYHGITYKDVA